MIERRLLQQVADRQQTTLDNIVREYFQHSFLSFLYQDTEGERLLFKGGTALRIIWHSPRFSEDLDFTGLGISISKIETLMENVLVQMEKEGIQSEVGESKRTSGGYLAFFHFQTENYQSWIQIEVSLRGHGQGKSETTLIQSDLVIPYTLVHLQEYQLIGEKIQACLTRGKSRDFYDLYFILRSRMAFQKAFLKDKTLKTGILKSLQSKTLNFNQELKQFLPINQHRIIKDFPSILIKEIERSLPL